MLPIERQKRIKEWVKSERFVKISQLSQDLGVSEMTIHRDIKPLIAEGIVKKTFGGIAFAGDNSAVRADGEKVCVYCSHTVNERLAYRLLFANGKIENTCCAHCGLLRHAQLGVQVNSAICHDFLRQTTISAMGAYYVMETSLHINCCQPQVLTFEQRDHAEKFVKGFGGKVYAFHEAMDTLHDQMQHNGSIRCHKDET